MERRQFKVWRSGTPGGRPYTYPMPSSARADAWLLCQIARHDCTSMPRSDSDMAAQRQVLVSAQARAFQGVSRPRLVAAV